MFKNNLYFEQEKKFFDKICKHRIKCKCSHTVILINCDRIICSHCGNWIYKNQETEFRYKLAEKMKDKKDE